MDIHEILISNMGHLDKYPIKGNHVVRFIKNTITGPNIIAGEYSYYDARNGESFEDQVSLRILRWPACHREILRHGTWCNVYYEWSQP